MKIGRNLVLACATALAFPAGAEPVPADCAALTAPLRGIDGYTFDAPPAANVEGWCVLDGASLRTMAPDQPNASVEQFRLRGTTDDDALVGVEVAAVGLRLLPKAGDRDMDDRLRSLLRLQTADLSFSVVADGSVVQVRQLVLRLGSGMVLRLELDVKAAGLDPASLLVGSLTALTLDWQNDGRTLRPLMEIAGEQLVDGAQGSAAVDAARLSLAMRGDNLPDALFVEDARAKLEAVIAALPHGKGRLLLRLTSDTGISAARVAVLAMSGDLASPEPLAQFFAGARLELDWEPGLTP